jgi:hypothetical protein
LNKAYLPSEFLDWDIAQVLLPNDDTAFSDIVELLNEAHDSAISRATRSNQGGHFAAESVREKFLSTGTLGRKGYLKLIIENVMLPVISVFFAGRDSWEVFEACNASSSMTFSSSPPAVKFRRDPPIYPSNCENALVPMIMEKRVVMTRPELWTSPLANKWMPCQNARAYAA